MPALNLVVKGIVHASQISTLHTFISGKFHNILCLSALSFTY